MGTEQVSTAELTIATVDAHIIFLLLGLYGWEYILSLDIEYALARRRLCFRWPLIPYILGRVSLLIYLTLLAAATSPAKISCLANTLVTTLTGDIALGCSSTIFMIRTWVIWKDSRLLRVLLLVLSLGQWALLATDAGTVKSISVGGTCVVYVRYPQVEVATLIYTTCYDLLVLVLLVVGLSRQQSESPLKKRLLAQGVLYFAVTGIAYIPPMVSALRDTSLLMIFTNSAITISTIASSRAVRSLLSLDTSKAGNAPESNIALTTQIMIQPSMVREDMTSHGSCVDEAGKC